MLRLLWRGLVCKQPFCKGNLLCPNKSPNLRSSGQQQAASKPCLDHLIGPSNDTGLPHNLSPKPQRPAAPQRHSKTKSQEHLKQSTNALRQSPKSSTASQYDDTQFTHTDKALQEPEGNSAQEPKPKQINRWLVDATSLDQILGIYAQHHKRFNTINLSTAFHRVAKHSKSLPAKKQALLRECSDAKRLAAAAFEHLQECGTQALTNMAWSQATTQLGPREFLQEVLELVAQQVQDETAENFQDHQLSIICWAATREKCLTRSFWDVISPSLCQMLPHVPPLQLSNVTWVCATAGFSDDLAFIEAAAAATAADLPAMAHNQVLSNLARSFARLGYFEQSLWEALARQTMAVATRLASVELGQLCWAFSQALSDKAATDGIGSLRGEVQKAPFEKTFISQENRDGLLEALRGQIMRLLYDDKPGGMSVLALSSCASAFANLGYYKARFLDMAADFMARDPVSIGLQAPVSFTWVCSTQRHYHPKFLQAFAQHGLRLLSKPSTASQFDDMAIATTVFAFANHTVEADDAVVWAFIRALADRATETLEDFRSQARANTAWGLAVLGHLSPAFFLKLRRVTLGSLRHTLSAELQQLYQVEMILGLEAPDLGLDTSHIVHYEALLTALQERGQLVGAARASWRSSSIVSSNLQQDVALVLKSLGLPFELEVECTQTDYTIDITLPDCKLAIEVDGPFHFMRNAPKATGRTLVKRRCLQHLGWTTLSVPFFHWNALDSPLLKQAYMSKRLGQARVPPFRTNATDPAADVLGFLPEFVVGPVPSPSSPEAVDMQIVNTLVEDASHLDLLGHPSRQFFQQRAAAESNSNHQETTDMAQMSQSAVHMTAAEQRRVLLQKAGKGKQSRHELLLEVAKHRRKLPA